MTTLLTKRELESGFEDVFVVAERLAPEFDYAPTPSEMALYAQRELTGTAASVVAARPGDAARRIGQLWRLGGAT